MHRNQMGDLITEQRIDVGKAALFYKSGSFFIKRKSYLTLKIVAKFGIVANVLSHAWFCCEIYVGFTKVHFD